MDVLHVDASFEQKIFHGKNFFVMANEVRVHGEVEWSVSGNDNDEKVLEKAPQGDDGKGRDGIDGVAGEFGGNVVVVCSKIERARNWSIKANGGVAAKGQEGGDGKDGRDGERFDDKMVQKLNPEVMMIEDEVGAKFGRLVQHDKDRGASIRKVFRNTRGSLLTEYNYYNAFKMEKLTMVEGIDGDMGLGGGRYGLGGEGGFAGEILMLTTKGNKIDHNIDVEFFRGPFGDDGLGGFHGK